MATKKKRTLRQQIDKSPDSKKPRRLKGVSKKVGKPLKKVVSRGKREFHPVKFPDGKAGRLLNKRVRFMPKFLAEAWQEIRQVTWPTPRETLRLSVAVFIFAVILTAVVAVLDLGLDKIFRELIIQ